MSAVTLDTLRFVKTLEAAGVEPKQAEMEFDLLKWIVGLALVQTGLVVGLIKLIG